MPVFVDATGRRRRRIRAAAYGLGGACTVYVSLLGVTVSAGQIIPGGGPAWGTTYVEARRQEVRRPVPLPEPAGEPIGGSTATGPGGSVPAGAGPFYGADGGAAEGGAAAGGDLTGPLVGGAGTGADGPAAVVVPVAKPAKGTGSAPIVRPAPVVPKPGSGTGGGVTPDRPTQGADKPVVSKPAVPKVDAGKSDDDGGKSDDDGGKSDDDGGKADDDKKADAKPKLDKPVKKVLAEVKAKVKAAAAKAPAAKAPAAKAPAKKAPATTAKKLVRDVKKVVEKATRPVRKPVAKPATKPAVKSAADNAPAPKRPAPVRDVLDKLPAIRLPG